MSEQAATDSYILERTAAEYERLRDAAQFWAPGTKAILEKVGVQPGMRCLDVGCGPGEVMRLMGQLVGPRGHVTGLDVDAVVGNEALRALRASVDSQFTFVEGNIEQLDTLGSEFDVVYARLTLFHLQDQDAALRKFYRWTKPGGHLIIHECDCRSWTVYPEWAGMKEFERVFYGVLKAAGRDPELGYKLPDAFDRAGIGPVDGTDVNVSFGPFATHGKMFRSMYSSLAQFAELFGIASDRENFFTAVENAMQRTPPYMVLAPSLIGVWRRKPETGGTAAVVGPKA